MRLAVIADIHGNLEALESVLAAIDGEGVEVILNLGDLVGYNASPNECLELLQDRNVWSLAGNHDLALFDAERAQHFNIIAHQALMWCREQLRPEFREFLRGLPLVRQQPGSMGLGTSRQRPITPPDWKPPPKPDLNTSGRKRK